MMQGTGHGEKLSRYAGRAIAGLLAEPTMARAAKAAGIGESTLRSWLRLPGFRRAFLEARRQALDLAILALQRAATAAVVALEEISVDGEAKASARVAAARTILELSIRGVELTDLAERVEALERRLAQFGGDVTHLENDRC